MTAPLAVTERTAAKLLDMPQAEFRRLCDVGALPRPTRIGDVQRWCVEDLQRIVRGEAAKPEQARFEP